MESKIVNGLNNAQTRAVLHTDGPMLILAGAGSGKTRVLTHKAAYLIEEKGIPPENILLCTFTNKAADEMKSRVVSLVQHAPSMMGTFHSLCARILRRDGVHIGLPPGFTIYDEDDALDAIKQSLAACKLPPKQWSPPAIRSTISGAKSELLGPEDYPSYARGHFQEVVATVYRQYQKLLQANAAVDFDDLLRLTVLLLQRNPDILRRYQTLFHYILVDEYQDVNTAQYVLTKLLAGGTRNVCVVGDASQSVYSFRGADFRNIVHFQKDYPDAKVFHLEQNYRSTQAVLDAAHAVIAKNTSHPVLKLWTKRNGGAPITAYEARDEQDEASYVLRTIEAHRVPYADAAVLYRTNAQSRVLEERLVRAGVPYRLVGGVRFYARREIKDLLSYLRLIANPKDSVARERILKIGKRRAAQFWHAHKTFRPTTPTVELINTVLDTTGYLEKFNPKLEEDAARIENINELKSVALEFPDLLAFLENVALVEQSDAQSTKTAGPQKNALTLMTLHSAKGLEFPIVFLVGMEEGVFPHSRALMNPLELEEERRLCYVGITRAKDRLFCTYARARRLYGSVSANVVSRFLTDIPKELVTSTAAPIEIADDEIDADTSQFRQQFSDPRAARLARLKRLEELQEDPSLSVDDTIPF